MPTLLRSSRGFVRQLLFRSPILLYRLGLGWLLGHQFLLLTHAGRRTGHIHQTVLKVLHYDPATHESVVASAWGRQADWYRNIQAQPALEAYSGHDWYVPEQRVLQEDEAFAVFEDWILRQRWFARLMLGQLGVSVDVPEAERRTLVDRLPFIGLRPRRT
jgi:deazaflavin-dependent oxidoreductase (nitroreductase family)